MENPGKNGTGTVAALPAGCARSTVSRRQGEARRCQGRTDEAEGKGDSRAHKEAHEWQAHKDCASIPKGHRHRGRKGENSCESSPICLVSSRECSDLATPCAQARARMVGDGKQLAPSKAGLSVQSDSEQNVLAGLAAVAKQKAGHGRVQADAVENVQSWANASGHAFVAAQPAQKVSRCRKLNSSRYSKTNGSGRLRSSASTEDSDGYSSRDEDNTSNIMSASDASIALTSRLSLGELSRNTSPESEADANNEQLQPLDLFKSASAGPERLGQHSSLRGGAANPPRVTPRILEVTKPSFKPLAEIVF